MKVNNLPTMARSYSFALSLLAKWLLAAAFACVAVWAGWSYIRSAELQRGAELYAEHCATCHGAHLEGQPDWQIADESGVLPAPPHDASGHTWHHDDAMLTDYIRWGGQAVLDDTGVSMTSGMPAFGEILEDGDIAAILAFIKSTWPDRIRAIQAERNGG
ncbi:cytochrome c [Paracoccus sp. Z118]|uniref:c-type cytochrome n=1 Tax=Paracoccus sp. Z118 TaxID=2851017 RepID=UPI00353039E3